MNKICPKCGVGHNKSGTFCSRTCANSRVFSEEAKLKKSIALKGKPSVKAQYDREIAAQKLKETRYQKYLATPFEQLGPENRRRRVFEEQGHCCARCGINEWQGEKLSLELEHKDGNNSNNARENLEALCPNCHSITPTWRGRNTPYRNTVEVSDEDLIKCLQETNSIRQALLKAGMAAKGGNYIRAKRLLSR
jgi:5-methylcytosine-specific restriction endonuclease McrA